MDVWENPHVWERVDQLAAELLEGVFSENSLTWGNGPCLSEYPQVKEGQDPQQVRSRTTVFSVPRMAPS
jgi:hypothetical protein